MKERGWEWGNTFSMFWQLQNSAGPAMEPQATQGRNNHYTTNQAANGLRPGSTGEGVKGHSLVWPQLKDKFYLSFC